jgi:hypothetical protein
VVGKRVRHACESIGAAICRAAARAMAMDIDEGRRENLVVAQARGTGRAADCSFLGTSGRHRYILDPAFTKRGQREANFSSGQQRLANYGQALRLGRVAQASDPVLVHVVEGRHRLLSGRYAAVSDEPG